MGYVHSCILSQWNKKSFHFKAVRCSERSVFTFVYHVVKFHRIASSHCSPIFCDIKETLKEERVMGKVVLVSESMNRKVKLRSGGVFGRNRLANPESSAISGKHLKVTNVDSDRGEMTLKVVSSASHLIDCIN